MESSLKFDKVVRFSSGVKRKNRGGPIQHGAQAFAALELAQADVEGVNGGGVQLPFVGELAMQAGGELEAGVWTAPSPKGAPVRGECRFNEAAISTASNRWDKNRAGGEPRGAGAGRSRHPNADSASPRAQWPAVHQILPGRREKM